MKTYTLTFIGRTKNALGNRSTYTKTVQAENLDAARLALYGTHEHISAVKVLSVVEEDKV